MGRHTKAESSNKPNKLWFKSKSFGYGWTPCSVEGWLITIFFIVVIVGSSFFFRADLDAGKPGNYLIVFITAIILLVYIAYKKGEKPRWNWGTKK